jgi:Putative zinc-finger
MDCEKFESALMDELYGELDELTSAATRRHVEGCARCAALMSGLRATRRVASLPRIEPPAGLERRILAAAAAATPRAVPFRGRLARAVSLAGSWAMRPQTAMAAVFLVMIGTSVLLLRGKSSRAPASAYVTVTEEGTPAPATPPATDLVAPSPEPVAAPATSAFAAARPQDRVATTGSPAGGWAQPPPEALDDSRSADGPRARAPAKTSVAKGDEGAGALAQNAAPRRGARESADVPSPAPAAPAAAAPGQAFAPAPESEKASEPAVPPSDPTDELWAARAARDAAARQGRPCPSGPRFDDVASRSPGSQTGWDALYEGALCYESRGEYGNARTRLGTLLGVPSYRDRARMTLDRINKEQAGGTANAGRAAPKAAPAAPPPAAAPAATDSAH